MINSKHLDTYLRENYGLSEKDAREIAASILKKRQPRVRRIWDVKWEGEAKYIPLKVVR